MLQLNQSLKNSILGVIIFAIILVSFNFLRPVFDVNAQEVQKEAKPELIEIIAKTKEGYKSDSIKDNLKDVEYDRVTIKSEFQIGEQTQTDFLIKTKDEDTAEIERELDNHRSGYLHNLENAPSVADENPEIIKSSPEEIREAREKINSEISNIRELKFLTKIETKDDLKSKLDDNNSFVEVNEQELKYEVPEDKPQPNPVKEFQEKTSYWIDRIMPSIQAEAQLAPDWVPDFSSVNFFDMDEVGTWVSGEWKHDSGNSNAQPSVAFGNGKMYVAVRGNDNKVYVGTWGSSNGSNFLGWAEIGNNWVTPSAPTIEWYWGRLYVGIRGTNNAPYYKYSTNGGATWTNWTSMGGAIYSGFDLERVGNSLYAGARGGGGRLYLNRMDNGSNSWTGWSLKGGWSTIDKPVLAAHNNTLYFGIRGTNNRAYVNTNALSWSDNNWREVRIGVDESFGMASTGSNICFLFRDFDSQLVQGCSDDPTLPVQPFTIHSNIFSNIAPVLGKDWDLMQVTVGGFTQSSPGSSVRFRSLGTSTDRGYLSEMIWSDGSSGFEENSTYEQKIAIGNGQNSNFQTYLGKDTTGFPSCMPTPNYATSNLPNLYLDTRVLGFPNNIQQRTGCDSGSSEVTYTIGSSYPKQIITDSQYINYWVDDLGQKDRPRYSLRFKRRDETRLVYTIKYV
ncbi:hypothetical protein HC766_02030 [Candidatus Gracilibacteria bacterium]|nr:hypothetical protein [Candidatus Gracilibacteria bacterium]